MTRGRRVLRAAIGAAAVGVLGSLMRSMVTAVTRDGEGSGTRRTTTHPVQGESMTEQPGNDVQSVAKENAADAEKDTGRPGRVRTEGETAVDDALGQGPLPEK